jgi:predicted nucleotide-binding protein
VITSSSINRRDTPVINGALLCEQIESSDLDTMKESLGLPYMTTNKKTKAREIITELNNRAEAGADEWIVFLNEVFFESVDAERRRRSPGWLALVARLEAKGLVVSETGIDSKEGFPRPGYEHGDRAVGAVGLQGTNEKRGLTQVTTQSDHEKARRVFIVHGRNLRVKEELEKFLKHIDVRPITWNEARAAVPPTDVPSTMAIIRAGFSMAQVVVVLFTPDDEARLKTEFHREPPRVEDVWEVNPTGQARQNVILEAGMALGMKPDKTVLVRVGDIRKISDIEYVNWIDLDNTYEQRESLYLDLQKRGVAVKSTNLIDTSKGGDFAGLPGL